MKTLHEIFYLYLESLEGKPASISEILEGIKIKGIGRITASETLRALMKEGMVSCKIVDGKAYFSSNPSYGEMMNPSQKNIDQMQSLSGTASFLQMLLKNQGQGSFPIGNLAEEKEGDPLFEKYASLTFKDKKTVSTDGYTIQIPDGFSYRKNPDETHSLKMWPGKKEDEEDADFHFLIALPREVEALSKFQMDEETAHWMVHLFSSAFPGKPESFPVFAGAVYSTMGTNAIVTSLEPKGTRMFRIDILREEYASEKVKKAIFEQILSTYHLDQGFIVRESLNQDAFKDKNDLSRGIHLYTQALRESSAFRIKGSFPDVMEKRSSNLLSGQNKAITKTIMETRQDVHRVVSYFDEMLVEIGEVLRFYQGAGRLSAGLKKDIHLTTSAFLIAVMQCSQVQLHIPMSLSENRSSDVMLSTNNAQTPSTEVEIAELPKHLEDILQLNQAFKTETEESKNAEQILEAHELGLKGAALLSQDNVYYHLPDDDFKINGSELTAYLGDKEEVTIPENITAIGFNAFTKARQLKKVCIPDGVTSIGQMAFWGCPNVKLAVYRDSYAQTYAVENRLPFELIKEEVQQILSFTKGQTDKYEGLQFALPDQLNSINNLPYRTRNELKKAEEMNGRSYVAITGSTKDDFLQYEKSPLFIFNMGDPIDYDDNPAKNVNQIAPAIQTSHEHEQFFSKVLVKDKLVVLYDVTVRRNLQPSPLVQYMILVLTTKKIIGFGFAFRDDFPDRAHRAAINSWIETIQDEEMVREQERIAEQKRKAEERRRLEKERREQEKKKQAEQKALEAERKAHYDAVCAECEDKKSAYAVLANEQQEAKIVEVKAAYGILAKALEKEIEVRNNKLKGNVKGKKNLKLEIEELQKYLANINSTATETSRKNNIISASKKSVQEYASTIDSYLRDRFPITVPGNDAYKEDATFAEKGLPEYPDKSKVFLAVDAVIQNDQKKIETIQAGSLPEEIQTSINTQISSKSRKIKRWIILVLLVLIGAAAYIIFFHIIPEKKYEAANQLYANGRYEEAKAILGDIEGYKDTATILQEIDAAIELQNIEEQYQQALSLINSGEYEQALPILESLGEYADSPELITEYYYLQAKAYMASGAFDQAIAGFAELGDYKNSKTNIDLCTTAKNDLVYNSAMAYMEKGQYEKAIETFESIKDYKNSKEKAEECKALLKQSIYEKAITLKEAGKYENAIELFDSIMTYEDSREQIELCKILPFTNAQPGDKLTFGNYNNMELTWIVLKNEGDSLLLITESCVDERHYHYNQNKPTYYIDSAIRDYLITDFYNYAFNTQEKKMIESRYLDTTGGSVSDPVFLLSDTEADWYFSSDSARRPSDGHEWFLRSVNSVLLDVLNEYALIPMYVKYDGGIYQYDWTVDYERGVRPAIWLDISSYVEKLEESE